MMDSPMFKHPNKACMCNYYACLKIKLFKIINI